ncbi:MAG: NAD(+) diphosphatase [Lachnospiraceae bacterium]|nr:NAD(+) diphosphatase [Lachnospiraceae bacterium]
MIQDINPRLENQYVIKEKAGSDIILCYDGRNVFLKRENENIALLAREEYDEANTLTSEKPDEGIYLFTIGEKAYYLCSMSDATKGILEGRGYFYEQMFSVRSMHPKEMVFALATGFHLGEWYSKNRFCGACGHKLVHEKNMRALHCEHCNNLVFPKINPAVIVAVKNGDKILLTTYAGREYKNYALVAGFAEIGETIEETVSREVMEEASIKVKNITYYKSQPWGFESDLLLGFSCEVDGDDTIKMDEEELASAEWIKREDMEPRKDNLSLTSEMMEAFRLGIL